MAQKSASNAAADGEQPKKRGKLLLIVSLVVVLAGGGGAAWFFLRPKDGAAEAKPKPTLFLPLDVFTANLMPDEGQPQFIQVGITLKTDDQATVDLIKAHMPEVRNRILLLLSGKVGADLIPVAGKEKLALDIAAAVKRVVAPLAPKKVVVQAPEAAEEEPAAEDTDGGEPKRKPRAKRAQSGPFVEVLFTTFMIQ